MSTKNPDSLADKLPSSNPGAVTLSRYRYQAKYAAMLSLKLLNDELEIEAVFCEHHDDILVKRKGGVLKAIQVKTRDTAYGPFKSIDQPMVEAITNFVKLELQNPDAISDFTIASNCNFYKVVKDKNNLYHILDLTLSPHDHVGKLKKEFIPLIKAIKKHYDEIKNNKLPDEVILKVLAKTRLELTPGIEEIEEVFLVELAKLPQLSQKTISEIEPIKDQLFDITTDASDNDYDSPYKYCFSLAASPENEKIKAQIDGKTINKDRVLEVISVEVDILTIIKTQNADEIDFFPRGNDVVKAKMKDGGIVPDNIENAIDQKSSTEYLAAEWLAKYGSKKANERYNHVKKIVKNACLEAHDTAQKADEKYGQEMLVEVRKNIKSRYEGDRATFFDCSYEHLLGFASLLTEECKVWWGEKFEIPQGLQS